MRAISRHAYPSRVSAIFLSQRNTVYSAALFVPSRSLVPSPKSAAADSHTFPHGFQVSGVRCGIKKKADALDFAMIYSEQPCTAAAVFTTNAFKAAPVLVSQKLLESAPADVHGVIVNSGCANACTGHRGIEDANKMMKLAANAGIRHCLIMSTGVIGPFLPLDKIASGITAAHQSLSSDVESWQKASRAIMTTDTVPKLQSRQYQLPSGKAYRIGGMCKGAGMIHPNMATMLAVITSDIAIDHGALQTAVKFAADRSFNAISVDGDMSTNDTLAVLCNAQANNEVINDVASPAFASFQSSLTDFASNLAQTLVRDGEGATKFVTIEVCGGKSFADCKTVASTIAQSALVKTAMFGQDANWGRIICAVGYSGVPVETDRVNLWFVDTTNDTAKSNLHLLKNGQPFDVNEARATELLKRSDIYLRIDLGVGKETAKYYTCDFSVEYVNINADYRS